MNNMKKFLLILLFLGLVSPVEAAWKLNPHTGKLDYYEVDTNTTYTAGDALTLTGTDIDFDGGASPGGELGGTWASPTIDDSLSVTSWNLTTPTIIGIANFNNAATTAGVIAIYEDTDDGTNNATITVPALAADTDYTLPIDDGDANEFLQTNGSGTLTWAAPAGSGDITAVGDVADGAAFTGTAGTYLVFNDAQGDGTLITADLSGAQTWTLPNASGTVAVSATSPVTLSAAGDVGLTVAKDIVAGVGLTGGEDNVLPGADADTTLTFASAELEGLTWGGGAGASIVWTFDLSGTDVAITFGSASIDIGAAALEIDEGKLTDSTIVSLDIKDATIAGEDLASNIAITSTGVQDFGGATSFEIPNGANPTTDAAGEIAVDTSTAPGSGVRFYGDAAYTLPGTQSKSFVINGTISNTSDFGNIWKPPYTITIKSINVTLTGGAASWSIVGHLDECDANGANCAGVDGATDITCTQGTNAADDGTLSNPSIDANDWIGWHTTSQTWTTGGTAGVTFNFTVDQVN